MLINFEKKILNNKMHLNNDENLRDVIELLSIEGITGQEKK